MCSCLLFFFLISVRLLWDLLFQIIFIYILLAIITGIVIDAFGALKEQKEADEDDLKSICFVCNIDRFTVIPIHTSTRAHTFVYPPWCLLCHGVFITKLNVCFRFCVQADQCGIGFDKHVKLEHRPSWYLFFLIYLQRKTPTSMTGQERYVFDKVWPEAGARDFRWLPREQAFTIHKGEQVDEALVEVQLLQVEVNKLNTKVDEMLKLNDKVDANHASMSASIARIEMVLSQAFPNNRN